jgi:hypothetical protein
LDWTPGAHAFRRLFVTESANRRISQERLLDLAGISNPQVLKRYDVPNEDELRAEHEASGPIDNSEIE